MKKLFIILLTLLSFGTMAQHGNFTDIRLINGSAGLAGTTNGTIYFNTGSGLFQFRQGGSWLSLGTGTITGSLTSGYVPKATGATSLGNSLIYDNATNIGIGTATPGVKLDVIGDISMGDNTASTGAVNIRSTNGAWQTGTNDLGNGTSGNQWYVYDASVPSYRLTVQKGTGRVGINTSTPSSTLDVSGLLTATNATVTTALINSALTSGRVPFITTSGQFTDEAALTYNTSLNNLLLTGTSGNYTTSLFGGELQFDDIAASDDLTINNAGITSTGNTNLTIQNNGGAITLVPTGADVEVTGSLDASTSIEAGNISISANTITSNALIGEEVLIPTNPVPF